MAEITVAKAQAVGDQVIPDAHIHITGAIPEVAYDGKEPLDAYLVVTGLCFEEQATEIEHALVHSLPGGTYDRLAGRMLARKATHFAIPYETKEA